MTIQFKIPYRLLVLILSMALFSCNEKSEKKASNQDATTNNDDGFDLIFDGKTLEGWHGDPNYWRVENGHLVGEVTPTTPLKHNTFIIWQGGEPDDFELKLSFRIKETGNSGVNYRSELLDTIPYALRGYQADIDGKIRYTGQNYEERKRTTLAYRGEKVTILSQEGLQEGSLRDNVANNCWQSREVTDTLGESDSLKSKIGFETWNDLHLIVKGNHLRHYVNGILMSEVLDTDTINRKMSGKLGMQVHVGPPMKVTYRNIRLKHL